MFCYQSTGELQEAAKKEGGLLPFAKQTDRLKEPLDVGGLRLENRIAIQPMEGGELISI